MRIAVFDYKLISTNPVGSCHLRMLRGLSRDHDFTVFAVQFENPDPQRIRFVRVPVLTRPLALLFVMFHVVAPLYYWLYRLRTGERFDLVQTVESNCLVGNDLVYAHFCHRQFLKVHWPNVRQWNLRGTLRWLDHFLHAAMEPLVFWRARRIVVPSQGLERELRAEYPTAAHKVEVLANPVDMEKMRSPDDFDRPAQRRALELGDGDVGLLFVALGHFERKGLPLILEAMRQLPPQVKLNVVGGERSLIETYEAQVRRSGLDGRVFFRGMQRDVRPFLWASDLFLLPSVYEVFPLVVLEAAAAGTPILATPLNGVEDLVQNGENGLIVERTADGIRGGIESFLALTADQRLTLAARAQSDVQRYSIPVFQDNWRRLYGREVAPPMVGRDSVARDRV